MTTFIFGCLVGAAIATLGCGLWAWRAMDPRP